MQFYYKIWNFLLFYNPVHLQENPFFFSVLLGVLTCINECRNKKYQYFGKTLISKDFSLDWTQKKENHIFLFAPAEDKISSFFKCDYLLNAFCFLASLADDTINVILSFYSASSEQIILLLYSSLLTERKATSSVPLDCYISHIFARMGI